jgi:diguanylate cyclase (GGDEF)-like protein
VTGRPRQAVVVAAVACASLVATGVATGPSVGFLVLAALVCATAGTVVRARIAVRPVREARSWRWFARALLVLAGGFAGEAVVVGAAPLSRWVGVAEVLGTVAASACTYLAVQYWNRYRGVEWDWDPGERLLGLGGLLGGASLLMYGSYRVIGEVAVPTWRVTVLVLGAAAPGVLALSLASVLVIARLSRDWRAWTLLALVLVAGALGTLRYVDVVSGAERPAAGTGAVVVWAVIAATTAVASFAPVVRNSQTAPSPRASSIGSLAIVVAGAALVVLDAVAPSGRRSVAVAAALSTLLGSVRLLRVVADLAELTSARREARTDGLTGVANRLAFMEHLEATRVRPRGVGVLLVDLDEFKGINDGLGHAVGDELMRAVADRIAVETAGAALLARLGGDEFALLVEDPEQSLRVAQVVLDAVRAPFVVAGHPVRIDASVGVASTGLGTASSARLLHDADTAMYMAKRAGGGIQVFDARTAAHSAHRLDLLSDLRTVLAGEGAVREVGELVVHLQPQVACDDERLVGVEALVRWAHPRHGLLRPAQFLPLAEEHRLMPLLTPVVLRRAAAAAQELAAAGWCLPVAVNLSASCLTDDDLPGEVAAALDETGLPAGTLVLEVTESAIMQDPDAAVAALVRLTEQGVRVSIDDYGTGHSSLSYLARLPATELKLDASFVSQLLRDERTVTIVAGTIDLAHRLGIRVTAEGVEDRATAQRLRELACDTAQGFVHSGALPVAELRDWLVRRVAVPAGAGEGR